MAGALACQNNSTVPSVSSKYRDEYEHDCCLGKGGFGLVLQAKNKVDASNYAIKRIRLPYCNEAREKVMREARALAKLNHQGIVRFYHAWFENPPAGWQEQIDKEMHEKGLILTDPADSEECHISSCSQTSDDLSEFGMGPVPQEQTRSSGTPYLREVSNGDDDESYFESVEDIGCENSSMRNYRIIGDSGITGGSSVSFGNSPLLKGKQHKCRDATCEGAKSADHSYLYIQMELCQRESLENWLKSEKKRDHVFCLNIFEQVVSAIDYLHNNQMMHRDLKPSNILFALEGSQVKVGDFGLVKTIVCDNSGAANQNIGGHSSEDKHTPKVGTTLYMSPEQEGDSYSTEVDIYALGIILFELFHPFGTEMERVEVIKDVRAKNIPKDFRDTRPLQAKLVCWLSSDDPKSRPKAAEILESAIYVEMKQQVCGEV